MPYPGQRPLALAEKELKMYFSDTQMLFFSLALPLVLIMLMVAAFGGEVEFRATAYLVNLDKGLYGAELIQRLEDVPGIEVNLLNVDIAGQTLEDAEIVNVVIIEEDFSEKISAGEAPEIKIQQRGTGGTEGQIVNSYVEGIAREFSAQKLAARQVSEMLAATGMVIPKELVEKEVAAQFAAAEKNPPVVVKEEAAGARPEPVNLYLPGLVTMFTLFALSLTAVNLVEERKKGTLERLMATGITRAELLAGTWLGNFGRGLVQVIFLFGLAWVFFRIFTPATFASVLVFGAIAVASVSGIGLVIAAISRTPEQANWIAVFFTMIMTILGGSFFDTSGLEGVMAVLTRLTYNFWANDGFRRIMLRGESLGSPALAKDIVILVGIGVLGWALALALFRLRGNEK
jgi:ABC-2 type transport system permease protein